MMRYNVEALIQASILLVAFVVTVGLGSVILAELRETQAQPAARTALVNESQTANTAVPFTVSRPPIISGTLTITNLSGGVRRTFIEGDDYTVVYANGIVTWINVTANNSAVNVSYSYDSAVESLSYNITETGESALSDFGDWFSTIVVVVVAGFIVALVLARFTGALSRTRS